MSPDGFLCLVLASAAFVFAVWYLSAYRAAGGRAVFYQEEFGPAVLLACGRGFDSPELPTAPALQAFLEQRADEVRCQDLPESLALVPLDPIQRFSRNLLTTVAILWRVTGVRWTAVDLLTAAFFSCSVLMAYRALSLISDRVIGTVVTLWWATSPWHLENLPHLRDYSKVPFFAMTMLATAVLLQPRRPRVLLLAAAAFGAAVGFGYGMRADVVLNLVPFVLVLWLGTPRGTGAALRVGCAVAACGLFVVAAFPILVAYGDVGTLWHVVLLGLGTPFDVNLNLAVPAPPYDIGYMYHDLYLETVVRSYWGRLHPDASAFHLWSGTYGAACRHYYEAIAAAFPADLLTRMVAAAIQVVNLPFAWPSASAPVGITNRVLVIMYEWRREFAGALNGAGPLVIATVLVVVGMKERRRLLLAFLVIGACTAYPALQYQFRHVFHLELLVLVAIAGLCSETWRAGRLVQLGGVWSPWDAARTALNAAALLTGLMLVGGLMLAMARGVQSRNVRELLSTYSSAAVDVVPIDAHLLPGGGLSRMNATVFADAPPPNGVQTAMVVAAFIPARCKEPSFAITFRYDQIDPGFSYDFTRSVSVTGIADKDPMRIMLPVYAVFEGRQQIARFAALEVPTVNVPCVELFRVRDLTALPLLLPARLAGGWQEQPLYQRLRFHDALPPGLRRLFIRYWPSVVRRVQFRRRVAGDAPGRRPPSRVAAQRS